jgi:hypothetical protein
VSSFVSLSPQSLVAASQDLTGIGSAIRSANAAAAVSTTQVAAAGQDAVSAAVTGVFGSYAQQYRAVIAQAGLYHDQFVQALSTGAGAYEATETANAAQTSITNAAGAEQTLSADVVSAQRTFATEVVYTEQTLRADAFRIGGLAKSFDVNADQILSADGGDALYQRTLLHRAAVFLKNGIFG